ncbi:protein adenylyltransferase SelO family protein [Aliivibrio fischeri]|uniref:protein adenylyltransferase SelO family protein n=1 Tax=Aliivibrio fischeri TaxID=668 RepID=UPI00080DC90E|nr:protein adenylyltransferase SelO family protein [Aliivibrio fischeri]OCH09176.1 MchC protein [Aliivibrio fischeri]
MGVNILHKDNIKNEENTLILEGELPKSAFTSFDTFRLKNTELLWINKPLLNSYGIDSITNEIENDILNNYSYVASNYANTNRLSTSDRKIFLADRYGSRHEVCNGGSARCGLNGQFQVKGIGLTPLLATNMSKSHANGKLFLDEAISEAIWGEICHKHLPFGAVRTLAIIKTNVNQEFDYLDHKPLKPCALAIREFAVRPAHFERCTFFWPFPEYMDLRDNDAQRVKDCIQFLPRIFKLSKQELKLTNNNVALSCLQKLVFSIAKQIAYSRVKGIPHGSLTSSNISIDGRFLDFGTITAVPDFGNYILADGVGGAWDDHLLIVNWLQNLALTLGKYSTNKISLRDIQVLIDTFKYELNKHENIAILKELNVDIIDNNSINIANDIKLNLINTSKIAISNFNDVEFRTQITQLAKDRGLKLGKLQFTLRNFKYSSFTILNHKMLKIENYSRHAVTSLIDSYC